MRSLRLEHRLVIEPDLLISGLEGRHFGSVTGKIPRRSFAGIDP